jgi:hypothetical protein
VQYLDTGDRDPDHTLFRWLAPRLATARYFGFQTGYFSADGVFPFEADLRRIVASGGAVRAVIGANEDSIRSSDVTYLLALVDGSHASSVAIVAAEDVLMHTKAYYIEAADGSRSAYVGSANLTGSGLASNIEAGVVLESSGVAASVLDEIKVAIEAWLTGSRPNAEVISLSDVPQLVADGVFDVPRPPRPQASARGRRRRLRRFPRLGSILSLPRRRRSRAISRPAHRAPAPTPPPGLTPIVKQLSARQDTKGFRGEVGTPYVALPSELASSLPLVPSGRRSDPKMDVEIRARYVEYPTEVITSGADAPNITFVGAGGPSPSHRDLRLNLSKAIVDGLRYVAHSHGFDPPQPNDPLVIEFLGRGDVLRLTFVRDEPLRSRLIAYCTTPRGRWGRLPSGAVPP